MEHDFVRYISYKSTLFPNFFNVRHTSVSTYQDPAALPDMGQELFKVLHKWFFSQIK